MSSFFVCRRRRVLNAEGRGSYRRQVARWCAATALVTVAVLFSAPMKPSGAGASPTLLPTASSEVGSTVRAPSADSWDVLALRPMGPTEAWTWLSAANYSGTGPYAEAVDLTLDGGRTWLDRTPPPLVKASMSRGIEQLAALGPSDAWIAYGAAGSGSPQTLMFTTDGGLRWASAGRLPSPYCTLQFVSSSVGWCVANLAAAGTDAVVIYRTADAGEHWSLESSGAIQGHPGTKGSLPTACDKSVTFSGTTDGWAAFSCPVGVPPLYESTDSGRSWQLRSVGPLPPGYVSGDAGAAWTSGPVFAGAEGAAGIYSSSPGGGTVVFVTVNGGLTWSASPPPEEHARWLVDVVTARTWKLYSGRSVLTTTDAGLIWRRAESNLSLPAQAVVDYVDVNHGWYLPAGGAGLERTTDGGVTWQAVGLPTLS